MTTKLCSARHTCLGQVREPPPPHPPGGNQARMMNDTWQYLSASLTLGGRAHLMCIKIIIFLCSSGIFIHSSSSLLLCFLALHFLTFYIVQAKKKCTFICCRVLLREKLKWNEFHRSIFIEVSVMAELNRNSADYIWPLGLRWFPICKTRNKYLARDVQVLTHLDDSFQVT